MAGELRLEGVVASPGFALGQVLVIGEPRGGYVMPSKADDARSELLKFDAALARSREQLERMRSRSGSSAEAEAVLEGQINILADPVFIRWVIQHIKKERWSAIRAVNHVINQLARKFSSLDDDYLAGRKADIQDVGHRIRKNLLGEDPNELMELETSSVVVARELKPSTVVQLEQNAIAGIIMASGSATSHAAIMARGLGIPCLVGVKGILTRVRSGDEILIDGERGEAVLSPSEETREAVRPRIEAEARAREEPPDADVAETPLMTRDGEQIYLRANISLGAEVRSLAAFGAEGVGLFRTEYLFLGKARAPGLQAQLKAYRRAVAGAGGKLVTFRTVDAGGDKDMMPLQTRQAEPNPALGLRSIRLSLREESAFKTQLKAILQVATAGEVRVMYPMITTAGDLDRANKILDKAKDELDHQGVEFARDLRAGIMVEVPAVALLARVFAPRVAFFSVGTNDLLQFTMAADRQNPDVADYLTGTQPALLELLRPVVRAAFDHGVPLSCCGEVSADPVGFCLLVALGFRDFSMNLFAVPRIREIAASIDTGALEEVLRGLRDTATAAEVQRRIEDYLDEVTSSG